MKLNILYVVPRCYTGSDRYYELLHSNIDNSEITWLPRCFSLFPFFLFFWRLFSSSFKDSDIIHSNCENGFFLYSPFKKLVLTFHHDIFDKFFFKTLPLYKKIFHIIITRPLYLIGMLLASRVIFVNHSDYVKYSNNYFWLRNKSFHIMNGIDLNELKDIDGDFFHDFLDKKRVLFIGKKSARKGWDLIESMFFLPNFSQIKLYCSSLMGHASRSKYFEDFGCLSRSDLLRLIKSVDVVFLPSKIEGFSYTVAESLSLGTPVLVTKDWSHFYRHFSDLFHLIDQNDLQSVILDKLLSIPKPVHKITSLDKNPYDINKSVSLYVNVYSALL